MQERLVERRTQVAVTPGPIRIGLDFYRRVTRATNRRVEEVVTRRGEIRDVLADPSVKAVVEVPVERNVWKWLEENPAAFEYVGDMIGVSGRGEEMHERARTLMQAYQRRRGIFAGKPSTDSLGDFEKVDLPNGQEILLELCTSHTSMHYPTRMVDPNQDKLFAFLGTDHSVANAFETRDGIGPRYESFEFSVNGNGHRRIPLRHRERRDDGSEGDFPITVNGIFEELQALKLVDATAKIGLPVGFTGVWRYARGDRVDTFIVLPHTEQPEYTAWAAFLVPNEYGDEVELFNQARKQGVRVEVLVNPTHPSLVRSVLRPKGDFHSVEIDAQTGTILRADGWKPPKKSDDSSGDAPQSTSNALPFFPDNDNVVIRPMEGDIDREVRRAENRRRAHGNRGDIRMAFDIVESGGTIKKQRLTDSWRVLPAQLAVARTFPHYRGLLSLI